MSVAITQDPGVTSEDGPRLSEGAMTRYGDVTLLVGPGDERAVGRLLAAARATGTGEQPGHRLSRAVADLLEAGDRVPAVCAVHEVGGGAAALVHGGARLKISTDMGKLDLVSSGAVSVDGFVSGRVVMIRADLGAGDPVAGPTACASVPAHAVGQPTTWHATSGPTVTDTLAPGAHTGSTATEAPSSLPAGPVAGLALPLPPDPQLDPLPDLSTAGLSMAGQASGALPPEMEELPYVPPAGTAPAPTIEAAGLTEPPVPTIEPAGLAEPNRTAAIDGVRCRKGHFNDPKLAYCGVCGIGLTQAGRFVALEKRPVLGVLLLDDGRLLPLDRDHLLGSAPELAEDVLAGAATAVRLDDPLVAGLHARVGLVGWEVTVSDLGSAHGTYVREPGGSSWDPVGPGGRRALRPGSLIAVGTRQLRFDTYRK